MIQCPECDSFNDPAAAFCGQCGGRLSTSSTAPPRRPAAAGPARRKQGPASRSEAGLLRAVLILCALALLGIWGVLSLHDESRHQAPSPIARPEASPDETPPPDGDGTVASRGGGTAGEPDLEPLSEAELERLAARVIVSLEFQDADGDRLPPAKGVLVGPPVVVLVRLDPVLPAVSGSCRVPGVTGDFEITGAWGVEPFRDLALLGIRRPPDEGETPGGVDELAALPPLTGAEVRSSIAAGLELFVASTNRWSVAAVSEYPFSHDDVVRLEAVEGLPEDALVALDFLGYVVGLCRHGAPDFEGGPPRLLIDTLGSLESAVERGREMTLADLSAHYYEGTFRARMVRARKALQRHEFETACENLMLALEVGTQERLPEETLSGARELLQVGLARLKERLEGDNRLVELRGYLERAVMHLAGDRRLWLDLARLYQRLGDDERAIEAAFEAVALAPGVDVDVVLQASYLGLAERAAGAGDLGGAAEVLLAGTAALPRSGRLHLELAKIYQSWEYFDDAARVFRMAADLDPRLRTEVEVYLERIADAISRRDAVVIPRPAGSDMYRTNALVNGAANVAFLVDTGANFTAITPDMARDLGIDWSRAPLVGISTAGGTSRVPLVTLDSIAIQGYSVRGVKALVLPGLRGDAGLLGLNFLEHFKYSFDPTRGELVLRPR